MEEAFEPEKYGVNMQALNSLKGFCFQRDRDHYDPYKNDITVDYVSSVVIDFGHSLVAVQDDDRDTLSYMSYHEILEHVEDAICKKAVHKFMGAIKKHDKLTDPREFDLYRLRNPHDKTIFYVGISCDAKRRYIQHIQTHSNNPQKDAVIQELKSQGLLPELEIIEIVTGKYYALRRETYWIKHYLDTGEPLTNIVDAWR